MPFSTSRPCGVVMICLVLAGITPPSLSQPAEGHLYWARHARSEVWRSAIDGGFAEPIHFESLLRVIALDLTNGRFFYGMETRPAERVDGLYSADLDGTDRQLVVEVDGGIRDIEIDSQAGLVYWIDESGAYRAELNGDNAELLVAGSLGRIAPDPANGYLYYTIAAGLPGEYTIRRKSLTTTEDVLIRDDYGFLSALEVDASTGWLYAADASGDIGVSRVDLAGANFQQLTTESVRDLEVADGFVYYSELGALRRMDLDGSNQMPISSGIEVDDFDLDLTNNRLYSAKLPLLARYDLDGSNRELLVGVIGAEVHGIAVDVEGERLFAVSNTSPNSVVSFPLAGGDGIGVMDGDDDPLDTPRGMAWDPGTQTVFVANNASAPEGGVTAAEITDGHVVAVLSALDNVHDVVVDEVNQRLFWTEGIESGAGLTAAIRSADLDGANVSTVLSSLPRSIRGIAVDASGGQIFWTDHGADEIWRADGDGGNASALITGLVNPHDVAVDPLAGKLYWTEGIGDSDDPTGAIRRSNLDGTGIEDIHTGLSASIRELTVVRHRSLFIFADGFESGSTMAWSSSVP